MNKEFKEWLVNNEKRAFSVPRLGWFDIFIHVEKDNSFDYLYVQHLAKDKTPCRGPIFQYVGLYCKKDGMLYDVTYDIKEIMEEDEGIKERSANALKTKLQETVRQSVELTIDNDRNNLKVSGLTDAIILRSWESFKQNEAKNEARKLYLNTPQSESPNFDYQCGYKPKEWDEESLLQYILDPDSYVQKEAKAYLADEENQEAILHSFLSKDVLKAEYEAILANPDCRLYAIKQIMQTVNLVPAKTLNVTIIKDGKEITFKIDANALIHDPVTCYYTYYIVAADRRRFEAEFGKDNSFYPEEITQITHGRSVLYQRD